MGLVWIYWEHSFYRSSLCQLKREKILKPTLNLHIAQDFTKIHCVQILTIFILIPFHCILSPIGTEDVLGLVRARLGGLGCLGAGFLVTSGLSIGSISKSDFLFRYNWNKHLEWHRHASITADIWILSAEDVHAVLSPDKADKLLEVNLAVNVGVHLSD